MADHCDRNNRDRGLLSLIAAWLVFGSVGAVQSADMDDAFQQRVRPLLQTYCHECHAGDVTEADVDLSAFTSVNDVRGQTAVWLKIRSILDSGQMPPKDSPQPSDDQRALLQTWVREFLTREAEATAGDPGPVVLRRLNNDEYNNTVRDLTGVTQLNPTAEFPVDGAAGEGFINTGSAQSMSPSFVTKYLDAAKDVAQHVVLLPDGIRFSPATTRRDHTDELLAKIQAFYRNFTEDGGGAAIDLQGVKFNTNQGGLLPVRDYLAATLEERDAVQNGDRTIRDVASERSLNAKFLTTLWNQLTDPPQANSVLINRLRQQWQNATPAQTAALADQIKQAQDKLWKFNSVGQLTEGGKQKVWMEPVSSVVARQELRLALPDVQDSGDIMIYLTADDLGDGRDHDFVVWDQPRFEFQPDAHGVTHPPLLLRDVNGLRKRIQQFQQRELPRTALYLNALASLRSSTTSIEDAARAHDLNPQLLQHWSDLVALEQRDIPGLFTQKQTAAGGYADVNGWGFAETPNMLANRSNADLTISTLTVPARGVVMHPSPTMESIAAWRSPIRGSMQVTGLVADADNKCGNGLGWRMELLSHQGRKTLVEGVIDNGSEQHISLPATIEVRSGDVVSLIVNSRDNNHVCDTTHVEFTLLEVGGESRRWDMATDIVDSIHEHNPVPDAYGNDNTWHFCANGVTSRQQSSLVAGSVLAGWRQAIAESQPAQKVAGLAADVQQLLMSDDVMDLSEPNRLVHKQLRDTKGPLRWLMLAANADSKTLAPQADPDQTGNRTLTAGAYGSPRPFGKHPNGTAIDSASLCVQAPDVLELRLPAEILFEAEFVTSVELHPGTGQEGSVQVNAQLTKPAELAVSPTLPFLTRPGSAASQKLETAITEFRDLFPPALCYARIVPVDEVVTLTLFFREDDHLQRLMLDETQTAELNRLWDELFYVAQEPLALTVAFEQIYEFATQDRPDLVNAFGPLRKPINERTDVFRQRLLDTQPAHLNAVMDLADRAWRRPLNEAERTGLKHLYAELRASEIAHDEAIQLTLARVLTSPAFLYRIEQPPPGNDPARVSSSELASRLSYFLWSSLPDLELRQVADAGQLVTDDVLIQQTRRMLSDERVRRLAIQFACQWMHLRDFDRNDDKNEALYPEFPTLRADMYEETVLFFDDMFRNDGSILDLLNADHTFLNEALARHYDIDGVEGPEWRRVTGLREQGRGGIFGMATLLASQSGASRTSPILRGNWVYETLLGERLPRPPANVPVLPENVPAGLTARQLIEQHSSTPECARCHVKIDAFGFALEQFDAIGRTRPTAADTVGVLEDGQTIEGLNGLRRYLATERRHDVIRQFCRKLLGFALGRGIQLSDEPLLTDMQRHLKANDFRFHIAVEAIVLSEQFRNIRGQDHP